jgi:hypothetical protein
VRSVHQKNAGVGHDGESFSTVTVEDVMCGAVEHPALGVAVRGHSAIDGCACLRRIETIARQWRELGQCGQERRRIGGTTEFLEHDRQLDGVLRVGKFRPARVDVGFPQRCRINAILGYAPHQRRRALLGHGVSDGLLP